MNAILIRGELRKNDIQADGEQGSSSACMNHTEEEVTKPYAQEKDDACELQVKNSTINVLNVQCSHLTIAI